MTGAGCRRARASRRPRRRRCSRPSIPRAPTAPAPTAGGRPAADRRARPARAVRRLDRGARSGDRDRPLPARRRRPRIPASTTKLATAAAALHVLGPQTRLPTIAYREGDHGLPRRRRRSDAHAGEGRQPARGRAAVAARPRAHGGRGDFAAQTPDQPRLRRLGLPGPEARAGLAVLLPGRRGGRSGDRPRRRRRPRATGQPRRASPIPPRRRRPSSPGSCAGRASTSSSVERGRLSTHGRPRWPGSSRAPVGDIVERMLTDSENNYAEALAHLTGGALLGKPTFAGGAAATTQALGDARHRHVRARPRRRQRAVGPQPRAGARAGRRARRRRARHRPRAGPDRARAWRSRA